MEVVNKYSYLGFVFTTTLSVKQGTDHLVAKGKNAVFDLCTSFQIWGLHRLDSIERVLMACKRYLGVPIRTPN